MSKLSKYLFCAILLIHSYSGGQTIISINQAVSLAINNSPFAKKIYTQKETNYWRFRTYRSDYNPQLRLVGNTPNFARSITPVRQPDGTIIYIPLNQTNPSIGLTLQQPLSFTGGMISVNTNYNYFNDVVNNFSQWNSSVLNIQLNQPLFSYNKLKWDKMIQPIIYEESKREYVEGLENISKEVVGHFFDVLEAQVNLQIAQFNLVNNDTIYKIEQGRYNIGTTSKDKLLQVELQLLKSQQDVAQASIDFESTQLKLKSFIGLQEKERLQLISPDSIPQVEVDENDALYYAKLNRAGYLGLDRRKLEAKSQVAQAKGNKYQTTLLASYGLNNVGSAFEDLYNSPVRQQFLDFSINIPILDWGRSKGAIQSALANERLSNFNIEQDKINFENEIITQVRQFRLLKLQIEITSKSDEIAQERYNVAQNRYLVGKVDITNLNIALTEKDNAKRGYLQALKAYWVAYYNLRRLTLYDFNSDRSLYVPNE